MIILGETKCIYRVYLIILNMKWENEMGVYSLILQILGTKVLTNNSYRPCFLSPFHTIVFLQTNRLLDKWNSSLKLRSGKIPDIAIWPPPSQFLNTCKMLYPNDPTTFTHRQIKFCFLTYLLIFFYNSYLLDRIVDSFPRILKWKVTRLKQSVIRFFTWFFTGYNPADIYWF